MREFEDKIDPFLVSVCFPCRGSEQSIRSGKSLVKHGDKIVSEPDFEFGVLVVFPAQELAQTSCVGFSV